MTWLLIVELTIFIMVAVGGITRLTDSGLSMVEWKPIMGSIPPLNEADWNSAFDKYKAHAEYQLTRPNMILEEFKGIFFWEYFHRMIGRLIGLILALPFFYFLARKILHGKIAKQCFIALLLGGSQGLLGWFMVKSGLSENPYVSHYRLAAHLALAFFVFCYILWVLLSIIKPEKSAISPSLKKAGWWITAGISVQIIYGAFVAGLKAGYQYNTFPKMGDNWLPNGFFMFEPVFINFVKNAGVVQFMHRSIASILVIAIFIFFLQLKKQPLKPLSRKLNHGLIGLAGCQFCLGVLTLVTTVNIVLATSHQLVALLLVATSATLNYTTSAEK